jgi:hypothetical protein
MYGAIALDTCPFYNLFATPSIPRKFRFNFVKIFCDFLLRSNLKPESVKIGLPDPYYFVKKFKKSYEKEKMKHF